jgi:hypothetical protein
VTAYQAAGLATGDVWETSTGRATQGYAAGVADARAADGQRIADGLPADQAIYFAVDQDTDWASVQPYFDGAHSVLGVDGQGIPRTGVYGGFAVIEGAYQHGLRRLWQTLAWSNGRISSHAVLYQNGSTALGGQADINDVLSADWGQYPHPNGDLIVATQQEIDAIAKASAAAILAATVPNQFRKDATGKPANTPVNAFLTFGDHHFDVLSGQLTAVKTELDAVKAQLGTVAAPTLSDAQVKALAAQLAPVLIPQLVQALGHALDGTPPAKP